MVKNKKDRKPKIKLDEPDEYPIADFKYLTSNKKYNFGYFNNLRESIEGKAIILDKIIDIQKYSWLELMQMRKNIGIEYIDYEQLKFSPSNTKIVEDSKVVIMRLNSQNWRLIGVKSKNLKNVLHIIGFDFDFSAYNHG